MSEKLEFWQRLVKSSSGKRRKSKFSGGDEDEEDSKLRKDLREFQCDVATNSEICHIGKVKYLTIKYICDMLVDCKTLEFHSTIVQLSLIFRNDFDMSNPVFCFALIFQIQNP